MAVLAIDTLSVGYPGKRVLSGVSLPPITTGQVVGVLGPNGAGKSTLLRALAGLMTHTGEVRLDGTALHDMPHGLRVRRIGYLPQSLPQSSSLLAYEAVFGACRAIRTDLTKSEVEAAVEQTFERLEISHIALSALNKLSGGQLQLVGMAQVIVREPSVLLFDEPTSALDLRRQLAVFRVLRTMLESRGGLALVALHDINLAMRHCDRLLILGDGGVLAYGPVREALTPEVLRSAYAVEGRIETCSHGFPFVVTDDTTTFPANRN